MYKSGFFVVVCYIYYNSKKKKIKKTVIVSKLLQFLQVKNSINGIWLKNLTWRRESEALPSKVLSSLVKVGPDGFVRDKQKEWRKNKQ